MAIFPQLLLVAQLVVAAPDTSPVAAFIRAVDTVTASGAPSVRGRTIYVDVAEFARQAGIPPVAEVRLPSNWRPFREADMQACFASRECAGITRAFVRTARVERHPDGSLVIFGTIHYATPLPTSANSIDRGGQIGLFHVSLKLEDGRWKVTGVGVARVS